MAHKSSFKRDLFAILRSSSATKGHGQDRESFFVFIKSLLSGKIIVVLQMREIRATWLLIVEELQHKGLAGWKERFQIHPHLVEPFTANMDPAHRDNESRLEAELENHVRQVLNLLHEVILHLDELELVADNLVRVGQRHAQLGIPALHLGGRPV